MPKGFCYGKALATERPWLPKSLGCQKALAAKGPWLPKCLDCQKALAAKRPLLWKGLCCGNALASKNLGRFFNKCHFKSYLHVMRNVSNISGSSRFCNECHFKSFKRDKSYKYPISGKENVAVGHLTTTSRQFANHYSDHDILSTWIKK